MKEDFNRFFDFPISDCYDSFMSAITKEFKLDIFSIDSFIHGKFGDYEDEGKSMSEVITEHYGAAANNFLQMLI